MATDPQKHEQLRRSRMLMLLMMIPWVIMMYYTNKQQKALVAQQQLREAQPPAAAAELDPGANVDVRVESLRRLIDADPKSKEADRYRLQMAVLYEEAGWYDQACTAYEEFAKASRGGPYGAHAAFHAGRIARDHLQDEKRLKTNLKRLGYEFNRAVWDPEAVGDPNDKHPAAEIAAIVLDPVYSKTVLYRILDGLVRIFDPQNHPEYAYAAGLVLLGLVARLLLWHLTAWGYRANKIMGAKMKAMKPQLDELKERLKDDQMAFMRAQQELMRKYGVSMKAGCLSGILQMFVLIPVYNAVQHYAYPLGKGSFLWIDTLQKPDLPLLICYVAAFILSMKLQPQQPTTDPQQQQTQKMMTYLMPVMFFFMMRTVPSAFILYWTVFLFFSTAQTLWFNRQWHRQGGDDAVIAALPPELQPQAIRPKRRDRSSVATPAEAGKGGQSRPRSAQTKPIVERTGETIEVSEGGKDGKGSFLGRVFAPALQGERKPGGAIVDPSEQAEPAGAAKMPSETKPRKSGGAKKT